MNSILTLSIISLFLQNLIGYLKFKKIINPISLFTTIHFFHNWSFSLSRFFQDDMFWRAPLKVSYDSMFDVLSMNLVGSWAFFLIVIIFAKTKIFSKFFSIKNKEILINGYYFLTLAYLVRFILNFDPNVLYGANQALDSASAFNPISKVFFFRIPLIITYIATKKISKWTLIRIVIFEFCLSFITFERKDLVYILSSFFLKFLMETKINIFSILKYITSIGLTFLFLMFIPIYRSFNYIDKINDKIFETFSVIGEYGYTVFFYIFNLANSEGVQNWTYQLIQNGEMGLLFGKSYIQATINMIVLRPFQGITIQNWQAAYYFKSFAYSNVTNTGYDFSFAAEAILNFGLNFGFISFIMLGLVISYLYSNRNKSDFYSTLYLMTWPIMIIGFRTDSTSMLRLYSYIIVIFILLYLSKNIKSERGLNNV